MQRKGKVGRGILMILLLLWMSYIFIMSAKPADESQKLSFDVGFVVGHFFRPSFGEMTQSEQLTYVEAGDHLIRKSGHFVEYAILGILVSGNVLAWTGVHPIRKKFLLSWGLGAGYAASDEIHQLFVPGRSGQISDVLLDSGGVLTGILLVLGFVFLMKKD